MAERHKSESTKHKCQTTRDTLYCTVSFNLEKIKLKPLSSFYLANGEHDEVNVGEVVCQPEVAPLPLRDGGLVEVGEGQLVTEVSHQLGP